MLDDPFDLQRFIAAQAPVYQRVCQELSRGRKTSHWIWFIFPQAVSLGRSVTAVKYGIGSDDEARAYLDHPLLGGRLLECTWLICQHTDKAIGDILPQPDDLKFRSSMTLFHAVSGRPEFSAAVAQFFDGQFDPLTLKLLGRDGQP